MSSNQSDFSSGKAIAIDHDSTKHLGATANLLAAIAPSFVNWTQNPGTNAKITDEDMTTSLTTNGIGALGENIIQWDLGSIRRRGVYIRQTTSLGMYCDVSTDNITFTSVIYLAASGGGIFINNGAFLGNFRYLRAVLLGVQTVAKLKVHCYNIN